MKSKTHITLRVEIPKSVRSMSKTVKNYIRKGVENMERFEVRSHKPGDCLYNVGVNCGNHANCDKCGWNPAVEKARKEKLDLTKLRRAAKAKPNHARDFAKKYYKDARMRTLNGGGVHK